MGSNLVEVDLSTIEKKRGGIICVLDAMIDVTCNGIDSKRIRIIEQCSSTNALIYNSSNGHGNAVCSIIHQINNEVGIDFYPVSKNDNINQITNILEYIYNYEDSCIINMSFGFFISERDADLLKSICCKLSSRKFLLIAANPSLRACVYPASFSNVVEVFLGKPNNVFSIEIASEKELNLVVNEAESLVWWRKDYIISCRAASFSAARISALLALAICGIVPNRKEYISAWELLSVLSVNNRFLPA